MPLAKPTTITPATPRQYQGSRRLPGRSEERQPLDPQERLPRDEQQVKMKHRRTIAEGVLFLQVAYAAIAEIFFAISLVDTSEIDHTDPPAAGGAFYVAAEVAVLGVLLFAALVLAVPRSSNDWPDRSSGHSSRSSPSWRPRSSRES
ncbi:hypothetical protein [Streptomyces sp. NPDC012508]|uniref:hypothetical protein n=1 Tax=Streptomyces sp. NPDC012508 TaxID=3364837 RepID=UPI0036BD2B70